MIDVWAISLQATTHELTRLAGLCSAEEIARGDAFVFDLHKNRHIACHGQVREILAGYTGQLPSHLVFSTRGNGKPILGGNPASLHFNLSHSGDLAVLAVSQCCDIGIDVELPRPVEREVATSYFAQDELAELDRLGVDMWLDGFYRCWTRKEAFIKATGDGLSTRLDRFVVDLRDGTGPYAIRSASGSASELDDWRLLPFRLPGGAIGAVCAGVGEDPVTLQWRKLQ